MTNKTHICLWVVLLLLTVSCGKGELVKPNFLINGETIVDKASQLTTPDAESSAPAVARVNFGENVTLKMSVAASETPTWSLNGQQVSSTENEAAVLPTRSGLQTVRLCLGDGNCAEKYIFVLPAPQIAEVVDPPVIEPPISEPEVVSRTEEPVDPPEKEPEQGQSLVPDSDPEEVEPGDVIKRIPIEETPEGEQGRKKGGQLPPEQQPEVIKPTPPVPPPPPKPLSKSKRVGPTGDVFKESCGKYVGGSSMLTIKPAQDIELRALNLVSEHCGKVKLSLSGDGLSASYTYGLSGGVVAIPLRDFQDRLKAGKEYQLKLTTSKADNCQEGLGAPGLGDATGCAAAAQVSSPEVTVTANGVVIYDLQFYY